MPCRHCTCGGEPAKETFIVGGGAFLPSMFYLIVIVAGSLILVIPIDLGVKGIMSLPPILQ